MRLNHPGRDGLVFARAALRRSMHYRLVVLFGRGETVVPPPAKVSALLALVDELSPGRPLHVRPLADEELAATRVVRMRIDDGAGKVAAPSMTRADEPWPVWSGIAPVHLRAAAPVPDRSASISGP